MRCVTELTDEKARGNGAGDGRASMTIDELARRTGMTVRNIRAHQSRGLVPPPEVRGRTGYYGDEHRTRIELIKELQADGFNLEAIRRLLEGAGGSSAEVLNFSRALRRPFEDEEPEILGEAEMQKRWGGADPELLKRAEKLGMLRPLDEGRFEILSPRLQRAGIELAALGIPAEKSLEIGEKVRRQARGVARVFVEVFIENVWKPFNRAGRPEEEWPKVRDALERLRPLASEALLAIFQQVMSEAVEEAAGREIQQELREPAQPGRRRRRRAAKSSRGSRTRRR
jgi:DNA-binding transcriptional MerR regulator